MAEDVVMTLFDLDDITGITITMFPDEEYSDETHKAGCSLNYFCFDEFVLLERMGIMQKELAEGNYQQVRICWNGNSNCQAFQEEDPFHVGGLLLAIVSYSSN